ncbi:MAG: DUF5677 domain-containing protein [Bacteroidales bacterium]|nr:DUF5677 domain-containing protein [Bacteroidales bacterium]
MGKIGQKNISAMLFDFKNANMNLLLDHEREIPLLIEHCYKVANALRGSKIIDDSHKYIEPLGKKILHHIVSAFNLYTGTTIIFSNNTKTTFTDFSSLIVLTRAAIESYLTFHYVYIQPKNEVEKEFRFISWDLAGYIERERYEANNEDSKNTKKREQEQKNECIRKIEKNEIFQKSPSNIKKLILKGKWRGDKSWADLAQDASVFSEYFSMLYSFVSSYSHSGRLSVLQVSQVNDEKEFCDVFQLFNLMILSRLILDYSSLFEVCNTALISDPAAYKIATIWYGVSHGIKRD